MGTVYLFRGKAATGKTTLAVMLARTLLIPVICKDDIVDALKMIEPANNKGLINNQVCYNILYNIIQTNLNAGINIILDIALGDRNNYNIFSKRLDFRENRILNFFITCSDESEWRNRHEERIRNPKPHQNFRSFEHVIEHYKNVDFTPFEYEHIIDTSNNPDDCLKQILKISNCN